MPDNETELIQRLRDGDDRVLGELFDQHRDRLWRMVAFRMDRRLAGRVDPDDVLQEAYLAAAQRLPHFREQFRQSFFLWLRLMVKQTLADVHRQHLGVQGRDVNREVSLAPVGGGQASSASLAGQLLGSLTSPSYAAARAELALRLEEALEQMSPTDREILALRHFEELTNSEVAEVLDIQPKAASIRYIRAIARLKGILEEIPGFGD